MKKLTIAMVAAMLSTTPVLASTDAAPTQTVTLRISTDGLNLSDPRDIAQLRSRVDKAIAAACTPYGVYRAYQVADSGCTSKMASDSQQVVARMTRDAEKSRMAEF